MSDSKSDAPDRACGFKSRLAHKWDQIEIGQIWEWGTVPFYGLDYEDCWLQCGDKLLVKMLEPDCLIVVAKVDGQNYTLTTDELIEGAGLIYGD